MLIYTENQEKFNNEVLLEENLNWPVRIDINNFEPREINQESINLNPHIYDDS